jgi:hypothetical protein
MASTARVIGLDVVASADGLLPGAAATSSVDRLGSRGALRHEDTNYGGGSKEVVHKLVASQRTLLGVRLALCS